jgi:hypothetical protein
MNKTPCPVCKKPLRPKITDSGLVAPEHTIKVVRGGIPVEFACPGQGQPVKKK